MWKYKETRQKLSTYKNRTLGEDEKKYLTDLLSQQSIWKEKIDKCTDFKIVLKNGNLYLYTRLSTCNSWILVSWRKSCQDVSTKNGNPLLMAMRHSIRYQIRKWKIENKTARQCVMCSSKTSLQADHHQLSFKQLSANFISSNEVIPKEFGFCRFGRTFKKEDVEFKKSWNKYHVTHANLQWLCKRCNVQKKRT